MSASDWRKVLQGWDASRRLVFCGENAEVANPLDAVTPLRRPDGNARPLAVLIGPEGGFAPTERTLLFGLPSSSASLSVPASCAPTRPPSRRSAWSMRHCVIGGERITDFENGGVSVASRVIRL